MKKVIKEEFVIQEKLGDFFVDIVKLVFAGVALSTLLDRTDSKEGILIIGMWSTFVFVCIGFVIYKLNIKK